jgi:hypothetical protein
MELSVRNSARQVGHHVAKYIMNTGLPLPMMSVDSIVVPSGPTIANDGGV